MAWASRFARLLTVGGGEAQPSETGHAFEMLQPGIGDLGVVKLQFYETGQSCEMLQAGASGYVPKRAAPDELVLAIRAVARGEVYLYPSLASRLVQDYLKRSESSNQPVAYDDLTPREREVLVLIAE